MTPRAAPQGLASRSRPGLLGRVLTTAIGVVLLAVGTAVHAAPAAHAAASVTVTNEFGSAQADLTYSTTITVRGSGFQSIQGGFGGIYVLFGWVDDPGGGWRPSNGGTTGVDYRYVPDSEARDNQGFQRFVAFPGSDTEYAANGGLIAADGSWSLTMVIPGPTFQAYDRDNRPTTVDCRVSTCGVITIGAHGVVNAQNESFTPVTFADIYAGGNAPTQDQASAPATAAAPSAPATAANEAGGTQPPAGEPNPAGTQDVPAAPAATGDGPTVTVDTASAMVGRVLSFSAGGFGAGEQVVASLDDGLAAVGPLTATANGTLAGVLELPEAVGAGTHILRIMGSSSGVTEVAFPVRSDPKAIAAAERAAAEAAEAQPATGPSPAVLVFLGVAGTLLLMAILFATVQRYRRRAARRAAGDPTDEPADLDDRPQFPADDQPQFPTDHPVAPRGGSSDPLAAAPEVMPSSWPSGTGVAR